MSACATRQDIRFLRGVTKTYRLTVVDTDGNRVDLTGGRVVLTVKDKLGGTLLFAKDSDVAIAEVEILPQSGLTLGQADIKIGVADTDMATPGSYVYDIWAVLVSGARGAVILPSTFFIEQAVTELP